MAVAVPHVRVADPLYNTERTIELARKASAEDAVLCLFPELGLSAYTNDDLFHQDALLDASRAGIAAVVEESKNLRPVIVVGAPLRFDGKLFNCAIVIHNGQILGITPKLYLPNYREFYEKRQFVSGRNRTHKVVSLLDQSVPFGHDILYEAENLPGFVVHTEICEDLWSPIPPSTYGALAGGTILCNLSASNSTIGKADYRRDLCAAQSGKMIAAYLYTAAGPGESTTDLAWDGHAMIYENDELLAESERFAEEEQIIYADVDLERLSQDRMRLTSFNDAVGDYRSEVEAMRRVSFRLDLPEGETELRREIDRFPYVPNDPTTRADRCFDAYHIQVQGLTTRMRAARIEKIIIGISGGLDSTQALIVAAKAVDRLNLPRTNILAYTLPGFATSQKTLANARALMKALGVTAEEIEERRVGKECRSRWSPYH